MLSSFRKPIYSDQNQDRSWKDCGFQLWALRGSPLRNLSHRNPTEWHEHSGELAPLAWTICHLQVLSLFGALDSAWDNLKVHDLSFLRNLILVQGFWHLSPCLEDSSSAPSSAWLSLQACLMFLPRGPFPPPQIWMRTPAPFLIEDSHSCIPWYFCVLLWRSPRDREDI